MGMNFFVKGFIIGISIAAPVGPIGILCIQRTLLGGRLYGLISGLGAATADAIYGFMAAFGLTFVTDAIIEQEIWFRLLGGGFLCFLGIKAFLSKPADRTEPEKSLNYVAAYGSTFCLTLANPMTILVFAAIFAGLGMVSSGAHYTLASLTVVGVFLGSGCWWFMLSSATNLFRGKLEKSKLILINRISGIVIIMLGLWAILSLII
jgi:threonine/homoserine/homoserine lactone efflux protein